MAAGKERALRRRSYLRNIPHLPSFMILKQKALGRAYSRSMQQGDVGSPPYGFRPATQATSHAGGYDLEAQHGASGFDMPQTRNGG
jgi:hypothetical protein